MKEFWEHGWKWALVGVIGLTFLALVLPIAHNMESGRDRDTDREEWGRD